MYKADAIMSRFTGIAVVIPTRNRADLAKLAIRSALQDNSVSTVTVLVSDNSTDPAQSAALRSYCDQIAQEQTARRLVYVQPKSPLPMGAHWEWARHQAMELQSVRHFLDLTDRTVLKPGSLARLARLADIHPSTVITFANDVVDDTAEIIRLIQTPWSGAVVR